MSQTLRGAASLDMQKLGEIVVEQFTCLSRHSPGIAVCANAVSGGFLAVSALSLCVCTAPALASTKAATGKIIFKKVVFII